MRPRYHRPCCSLSCSGGSSFGGACTSAPSPRRYLGIIEQRTNEILQLYAATQAQARDHTDGGGAGFAMSHILGQGPQLPAGSNSITIQPPSTGEDEAMDSDEVRFNAVPACSLRRVSLPQTRHATHVWQDSAEEEDDRPFSRDELKAKTIRGLHKRESKEKKKDGKRKPPRAAK